jgi:hypothetical protein
VSGRLEQLARQIRRLRTTASDPGRTLQRALHLASDLAGEETEGGDFGALVTKGLISAGLAERLAALTAKERIAEHDVTEAAVVDLDVFLRSIEIRAPAQPLPLAPLHGAAKLPPGTQKTSINISGRVVTLVGRDGRAFVLVDDKPIGKPFDLQAVPMTPPTVERERDGTVRIVWDGEIQLQLAGDFVGLAVMPA